MTTFLLIRHADTPALGKYLAGTASGTPLTARGREQVQRLADRLSKASIAAVYTSPLERTRATADAIAAPHGLAVCVEPSLGEVEAGEWTGLSFEQLDPTPEWQRYNRFRSVSRPPGGELLVHVQQRAVEALLRIAARHPADTVAIVSHGDVIRAVLLYVLGMPIDFYTRIDIAPAKISVVAFNPEHVVVTLVNADTLPE
jgi:probable phosphoglycerate mutase